MAGLSVEAWHERYTQQAQWTKSLRQYLFNGLPTGAGGRLLEVGCGTGALLAEFEAGLFQGQVCGLDIAALNLGAAAVHAPQARLVQGDALRLPYAAGSFDLVCCHFLLLWVKDPQQAVTEMLRVTRPGGTILALAEPDYGGRIDYPDGLEQLGRLQAQALREQGADPETGRKLAGWFHSAGLRDVESGVLGGQWQSGNDLSGWQGEWKVLEADLSNRVRPETLAALKEMDRSARQQGSRVLFVPTFYASARVI